METCNRTVRAAYLVDGYRILGASLLVIARKSGTGFLGYLGQVEAAFGFIGIFSMVATLGILLGTYSSGTYRSTLYNARSRSSCW